MKNRFLTSTRILTLTLILTLLLSAALTACGNDKDASASDSTSVTTTAQAAVTTTTQATTATTAVTTTVTTTAATTTVTTTAATTTTTTVTTTAAPEPVPTPAFEGTLTQILDSIVEKACQLDPEEYGIKTIPCTDVEVDSDRCETILGLTDAEYSQYVEAAVESKPNGSWYAHSVVVVKLKDGVNVDEAARKIVAGTSPSRFGCLKAGAISGAYADQYVIFAASGESSVNAVMEAVKALSAVEPTVIPREKNWNTGGLFIGE